MCVSERSILGFDNNFEGALINRVQVARIQLNFVYLSGQGQLHHAGVVGLLGPVHVHYATFLHQPVVVHVRLLFCPVARKHDVDLLHAENGVKTVHNQLPLLGLVQIVRKLAEVVLGNEINFEVVLDGNVVVDGVLEERGVELGIVAHIVSVWAYSQGIEPILFKLSTTLRMAGIGILVPPTECLSEGFAVEAVSVLLAGGGSCCQLSGGSLLKG